MCAIMNFEGQRQSSLKTQISENARRLIEEHEIVIPEGVRYHLMPKKWWEHLRALEDAIWPFAIVACRMKPAPTTPLIDRDQFGPLGRQHLDRMKVPTTRSGIEELEAIVVDTKTFHCTLGYVWEMDKGMPPKQWADEAALGLKVAYMRGYNL